MSIQPSAAPDDKVAFTTGSKVVLIGGGLYAAAIALVAPFAIQSSDIRKMAARAIASEVASGVTILGPHQIQSTNLLDAFWPKRAFTVNKVDVTQAGKYRHVCVDLDAHTIGEKIFSFAPVCTTVRARFYGQSGAKASFGPG